MGFSHAELMKYLKKADQWGVGIGGDQAFIDSESWLALRRDVENTKTGESKTHFYIILPKAFDFSDYDYIRLSHEVLHISIAVKEIL